MQIAEENMKKLITILIIPHHTINFKKIYLSSINKNFKRAYKQVNLHLFKWHYISSPSNAINYYNEHESSKNASTKISN